MEIEYLKKLRVIVIPCWFLSQFLSDHYHLSEAERLVLGINDVISEHDQTGGGFYTQSNLLAMINMTETKIYSDMDDYSDNPQITPEFILPTEHFKFIAKAQRDYLQM